MTGKPVDPDPELLLFDLGDVLVEFSAYRELGPLLGEPLGEAAIRGKWTSCPIIREFEVGGLTREAFAARFVAGWGLTISPEAFLDKFRSWTSRLLPGAEETLAALRGRYRLACLSNSNEVHWERNASDLGIPRLFEAVLSSHQLGLHKPDPAIFERALEKLRVEPEAVAFFDDSAANVAAAQGVGIHASRVEGVAELRACLAEQGLLPQQETA